MENIRVIFLRVGKEKKSERLELVHTDRHQNVTKR
jgi:hypothetical protein